MNARTRPTSRSNKIYDENATIQQTNNGLPPLGGGGQVGLKAKPSVNVLGPSKKGVNVGGNDQVGGVKAGAKRPALGNISNNGIKVSVGFFYVLLFSFLPQVPVAPVPYPFLAHHSLLPFPISSSLNSHS